MFGFRKKKNQEILQNYKKVKSSSFDFDRIALYFNHKDKSDVHQVISDSTAQDLDFEELFMYMDRTCSVIGQQYLYATLNTIPKDKSQVTHVEKTITYFKENPEIEKSTVLELSRLNKTGAYFLQRFIYGDNIVKPKWFWVIPALSTLSIVTMILSFIFPVVVLAFFSIILVNTLIHFWNKNNVLQYSNTIPQLLLLNRIANEMIRFGVILNDVDQVKKSNDAIGEIAKVAVLFKWESKFADEISQVVEYILDLIKAAFLLEPLLFFKLMRDIELKKTEIGHVFTGVAEVDVALSISSFRETLPYYSLPETLEEETHIFAKEIYHPLTSNPVSNSIDLSDSKSVLISGSNMSGKTTFIRTIGINAILAQTINTVCAREFSLPTLKVHSAIRIADNLLDDTSYYFEEVKTIKKMIEASESHDQNLFLLDELFKGTNTVERISSGKAILSFLSSEKNTVFASTHDIELTDFLSKEYNYFHFSDIIENDKLTFDYKLRSGKAAKTNAIKILEINKFPKAITEEAKLLAEQLRESKNNKS